MNKNLYIGNLSHDVTEEDLKANFAKYGTVVSVSIIKDKFTGMSKGFGFVEMETEEQAKEAVEKLNGGELSGRTITVNEARPKQDRDRGRPRTGGGGRGGFGGGGGGRGGFGGGGGGGRGGRGGGGRY
jgi:RNA recognition motif-containing protein